MSRWFHTFFLGTLLAGFLSMGVGAVLFVRFLETPLDGPRRVVIDKGWNLTRIARFLEAEGIVPSAQWFVLLGYFHHRRATRIHAGEYRFLPGETPPRILIRLEHGDVVRYQFSFPEGLTVREVAARMQEEGWKEALTLSRETALLKKLGLDAPSLEGWLFPETYFFVLGDTTLEMLARMTRMTRKVLHEEWRRRAPEVQLTPLQALTLASIIEKETGRASERQRISGVFHNRLRRHMRLESDPTVIYGLHDYRGDITRQHLLTPTPFNTYTQFGLPPTPICNPGQASIHAALHPEATEELFFVAQGDGSHVFAKSFAEHKQNVSRFQLGKRGREVTPPEAPAAPEKPV
ncbi:MAG: endolytic transglycosylase MltG, partial [Magnetococcales bacterium]|nr:endolytic transglycosylase MltG [Magnetococcales bacterium]